MAWQFVVSLPNIEPSEGEREESETWFMIFLAIADFVVVILVNLILSCSVMESLYNWARGLLFRFLDSKTKTLNKLANIWESIHYCSTSA